MIKKSTEDFAQEIGLIGTIGAISVILSIITFFTGNWPAGIFFIILAFILVAADPNQQKESPQSFFEKKCKDEGFEFKPNFSDEKRRLWIGLAEKEACLMVQFGVDDTKCSIYEFNIKDILNVELKINATSIYRAGPIASVAAAAAGGVGFGGAGAIVGAVSAGSIGSGKISRIDLTLRMDDIEEPHITIPFLLKAKKGSSNDAKARIETAEKWTNLIEVLRYRVAKG